MKNTRPDGITREKHLDHMTRVVPFIVFCYAIQSYVVYRVSPTEFSRLCLFVLGCFLAAMVAGFVMYDLKHKVKFEDEYLEVSFLWSTKKIFYTEITSISHSMPVESFSTLTIYCGKK